MYGPELRDGEKKPWVVHSTQMLRDLWRTMRTVERTLWAYLQNIGPGRCRRTQRPQGTEGLIREFLTLVTFCNDLASWKQGQSGDTCVSGALSWCRLDKTIPGIFSGDSTVLPEWNLQAKRNLGRIWSDVVNLHESKAFPAGDDTGGADRGWVWLTGHSVQPNWRITTFFHSQ